MNDENNFYLAAVTFLFAVAILLLFA